MAGNRLEWKGIDLDSGESETFKVAVTVRDTVADTQICNSVTASTSGFQDVATDCIDIKAKPAVAAVSVTVPTGAGIWGTLSTALGTLGIAGVRRFLLA